MGFNSGFKGLIVICFRRNYKSEEAGVLNL